MIKIKTGVNTSGVKTEIILAIQIANSIYSKHNVDCVITELTGGTHSRGSLHYVGFAVDLRTRDFDNSEIIDKVSLELKESLGDQYDVVLEKDHIHIEFQPKIKL